MLEKLANIFRVPDLRKRILFTLGLLAVYRLGGHIPTPGINADLLSQFGIKVPANAAAAPGRPRAGREPPARGQHHLAAVLPGAEPALRQDNLPGIDHLDSG